MKKYQSIKQVHAKPMSRFEAQALGLVRDLLDVDEEGYCVVYSPDYTSWSPKNPFEEGYQCLTEEVTNG